jgi:hypothetical protein
VTRTTFVTLAIALCCALPFSDKANCQPSTTAPTWQIGKIAIQAAEVWVFKPPLLSYQQIRGSGFAIGPRNLAEQPKDYIAVANTPGSEQKIVVGDPNQPTNIGNGAGGIEPALSPDGHYIVYCGTPKASHYPDMQLIKVNTETREKTELTHLKNTACNPAWSPDGSKIAFDTESTQGGVVAVLDLASLNISAIAIGARPQWSPDGKRLVFLRWPRIDGGPQSVWIVNADGSNPKKVSDSTGLFPSANWGADGASIIFTSEDKKHSAIFRANLDGSSAEKIAGDKHVDMYFPSVSPDGKELLVIADSGMAPNLLQIDLNSHTSRVLCNALRASVNWVKKQ